VNHRIFERKWRSWVFPGACLSECRFLNITRCRMLRRGVGASRPTSCPLKGRAVRTSPTYTNMGCAGSGGQKRSNRTRKLADEHNHHWPQIRQDYPLNLSILISGGKETNKDSLSNGEWSGISSNLKSAWLATPNCSL